MRKCNNCLAEIDPAERICPFCRSNVPYAELSYGKGKGRNLVEAGTALLIFGVVMFIVCYLAKEPWTSPWTLTSIVFMALGTMRFLGK